MGLSAVQPLTVCVGLVPGPISVTELDLVATCGPAGSAVSEAPSVASPGEGEHCSAPVSVTTAPLPYPFSVSQGVFFYLKIENVKYTLIRLQIILLRG